MGRDCPKLSNACLTEVGGLKKLEQKVKRHRIIRCGLLLVMSIPLPSVMAHRQAMMLTIPVPRSLKKNLCQHLHQTPLTKTAKLALALCTMEAN
jgi:hypothetical protein